MQELEGELHHAACASHHECHQSRQVCTLAPDVSKCSDPNVCDSKQVDL